MEAKVSSIPVQTEQTETTNTTDVLEPKLTAPLVPAQASPEPAAMNTHSMVTRAKNQIHKPNLKYGLTAILKEVERESHTQALKD